MIDTQEFVVPKSTPMTSLATGFELQHMKRQMDYETGEELIELKK
jgi:hypothetical protein